MTVWHAAGMPEIRRELVRQLGNPDGIFHNQMAHPEKWSRKGIRTPMDNGRRLTPIQYGQRLIRWAQAADLYLVSPEMTAVVGQAARSVPPYRFLKEDMPSSVGLVVWADPIQVSGHYAEEHTTIPLRAALWAPAMSPWGPGVHIAVFTDWTYFQNEAIERGFVTEPEQEAEILRRGLSPFVYFDEAALPYAAIPDFPVESGGFAAVMATWLIMGQRVAVTTREKLPRQMLRQAARRGEPEPKVRTITLRRARNAEAADADGQGPTRTYHHQWIVKGFWRNQWYPSEERHKPIFIADYVKGPAWAPMLGGERVSVLRR